MGCVRVRMLLTPSPPSPHCFKTPQQSTVSDLGDKWNSPEFKNSLTDFEIKNASLYDPTEQPSKMETYVNLEIVML